MAEADKIREQRARRALQRRGYRLSKSRVRDPKAIGYGTFSIIGERAPAPRVVFSHLNLDQVEQWLDAN